MRVRWLGIIVMSAFLPASASAQVTIEMGAFTCGQYLAMSPAASRDFSAWLSGWSSYQTRRTSVDILAHQKNIEILKTWCQMRPNANVLTAVQTALGVQ